MPESFEPIGGADATSMLVLDTNIVLDLWVFKDPTMLALHHALRSGQCRWVATTDMRDELVRVLDYPKIVRRMAFHGLAAGPLLAYIASYWQLLSAPCSATVRCADPDDQKFLDLAVHVAMSSVMACPVLLLSKDHAVRCLAKPLLAQGVKVSAIFPAN